MLAFPGGDAELPSEQRAFHWETVMLRRSSLWLAVLSVAASFIFAPVESVAGGYFGHRHGFSGVSHWAYYGGVFVPSGPFGRLHEHAAWAPNCAFLRRMAATPLGPHRQLVPVCF